MGELEASLAQVMGTEMLGLSKFVSHCSDNAVKSHVRILLKAGGSSHVCTWVWSSKGSALCHCLLLYMPWDHQ